MRTEQDQHSKVSTGAQGMVFVRRVCARLLFAIDRSANRSLDGPIAQMVTRTFDRSRARVIADLARPFGSSRDHSIARSNDRLVA